MAHFVPNRCHTPETGEWEIVLMKWGLVPYWSKTVKLKYNTINADADKLTTSGVWRESFRHRRCLVPAGAICKLTSTT
jgi:putative SOS response-associated peptidase YedK